ncbi:hypothetical protein CLOSTMETH_01189 [[Clostridium] methylpentosum DSM 5476]|uniref:Uncharacterized protein n=1 Tax=[Clostridium] methylpentosum DSM 5476 TaxID=537013 RepID=C0EBH1_9FIRM|nr:hypothetical protein CLOSTMETH_01189 [[Clostridium] methylpentosum DSM 5476]
MPAYENPPALPGDSYFELNTLVVVKPNEIVDERTSLRKKKSL